MGKKKAFLIAGALILAALALYGIQQPVLFRFGKLPGVRAGEIVLLNPLRAKDLEIQTNRILREHLNAKTTEKMQTFYMRYYDDNWNAELYDEDTQNYILETIEKNSRFDDIRCEILDIHDEKNTVYYAINVFRRRKSSQNWDDGQYGMIIFNKQDKKVTKMIVPY